MTPVHPLAKAAPPSIAVRCAPFDPVTIAVHWTTLVTLLATFALALSIDRAPDAAAAAARLTAHRSLGALLWSLTVFRLGWRLTCARLPAWPQSMPRPQRLAARASEYGLYALLLAQPLTGLLQSLYRGKAFRLLAWTVPALLRRDRSMLRATETLHTAGAVALALLVGLHAAAALLHLAVRRDGVFESMAPVLRRAGRGRSGGG